MFNRTESNEDEWEKVDASEMTGVSADDSVDPDNSKTKSSSKVSNATKPKLITIKTNGDYRACILDTIRDFEDLNWYQRHNLN